MMWKTLLCGTAAAACTLGSLRADIPNYYSMLADDMTLEHETMPLRPLKTTFWKPSSTQVHSGFAAGLVPMNQTPDCSFLWPEVTPETTIRLVAMRQEFRAQPLAVRILRPLKTLNVILSELKSDAGDTIDTDQLDLREVKYRLLHNDRGEVREGNFLRKFTDVPRHVPCTIWLWLTVHVPENTPPGLYAGTMRLQSEHGSCSLPIQLQVCQDSFRWPKGLRGCWMPGHFHGKTDGYCRNYAPTWWNPQELPSFFRFWNSRGMTAPVYSGIYPQIWMSKGKIHIDFSEINQFVAMQKAAGVTGKVICDTLLFEYWAHAARVWMDREYQGKRPAGELGIFRKDAKTCADTGKPYNEKDAALYCELLRLFDQNAKQHHWPDYVLYPEEEVDNRPYKTAGYEYFMPWLRKTLGDNHAVVIDNNVGYDWGGLDRGKRDRLFYRNFNNWDTPALQSAAQDKAEIWTFNQGFNRLSWGLRLFQLNAKGYSQWAEAWDGGSYGIWFNVILKNGKVLTSVNYERASMGLRDLAPIQQLQEACRKLKDKGLNAQANALEQDLRDLIRHIPLPAPDFFLAAPYCEDQLIEAIRYRAIINLDCADQLLGLKTRRLTAIHNSQADKAQLATPPKLVSYRSIHGLYQNAKHLETAAQAAKGGKQDAIITARYAPDARTDGQLTERALKDDAAWSSDFVWMESLDKQNRAKAASAADYRARYQPLKTQVAVTWNRKGLLVHVKTDSPAPQKLLSKLPHNAPEMWKDDSVEVLLRDQALKLCHIYVNGANHITAHRNWAPETNHGIVAALTPHDNGGFSQEIFVPWKWLGRSEMPLSGERLSFNVGRRYHALDQCLSWVPVTNQFYDSHGFIECRTLEDRIQTVNLGSRKAGWNQITGTAKLSKKRQGFLKLLPPHHRKAMTVAVAADGSFALPYQVSQETLGRWRLEWLETRPGKKAKTKPVTSFVIPSLPPILVLKNHAETVIAGQRTWVDLEINLGNAEKDIPLVADISSTHPQGLHVSTEISLPCPGLLRIYLDSGSLPAGDYRIGYRLKNCPTAQSVQTDLSIMPSLFHLRQTSAANK